MLKKSIAKDNKQTWQLADIIHQELDSRWESLWVSLQSAITVSLHCGPAVVNVDIDVASFSITIRHQTVRHIHVQSFTNMQKNNSSMCQRGKNMLTQVWDVTTQHIMECSLISLKLHACLCTHTFTHIHTHTHTHTHSHPTLPPTHTIYKTQ